MVRAGTPSDRTTTLGTAISTIVLTLDPRGCPISGADIAYAAHASPDDQGTIDFVGGPDALSNPDGSSFKDVVVTTAGKIGFDASFVATFTAEPLGLSHQSVQALRVNAPIPRFQPVAKLAYSVGTLAPNGTIRLNLGAFERLPIERRHLRKDVLHGAASNPASGGGSLAFRVKSAVIANKTGSSLGPDPGYEPIDASTAVPLPDTPRRMVARAQAITSCSVAQTEVAGVTAQAVNPPYTVTLTDLTPSTGQTEPNGEVGVDGIHGHRVEKTIRLKIQVKDKDGLEPTYPILVHLVTGGPHHGTIILDPDETRQECSDATFLWHERDAQGNLIALNEEFEYRMGTWSRYVGVEPDPNNPPQVRPVWGAAEDLEIGLETPDGAPLSYHVRLEPGKPDHFLCLDGAGQQCPDILPYWADYLTYIDTQTGRTTAGPFDLFDAYFLKDQFNNTVYGYTDTSATQPAPNVVTEFKDQTQGDGGDFAGYQISTSWDANPSMPAGQLQSTLSVEYPDDPAGDWSAGTVAKTITYDFEGGSSHVLVQKQNYDESVGVDDLPFPLSVPPGANEGSMPTTAVGDTPRLVLLALTGPNVPASVAQGTDEPSLDQSHVYRKTGSTWTYTEVSDPYPTLEVQDAASKVKLSLVDGNNQVITGTSFRVHTCPRAEHLTQDDPPGECTDTPVDSDVLTGVIAEYTINPVNAQRGYMGIELTQAPVNPGTYFVKVESLGPTTYRIRRQGQFVTDNSIPDGEYQGAFEICTVLGGEILDENFRRIEQIEVASPEIVYVRYVLPGEMASEITADLETTDGSDATVASVAGVALARVGASDVFLSGPITVEPNEDEMPAGASGLAARVLDLPGATLRAAGGPGHLHATPAAYRAASIATLSGLIYDFRIGTLANWPEEPNLIFGNDQLPPNQQDYINMSVRITAADGTPLGEPPNDGWTVSDIRTESPSQGWVDPTTISPVAGDIGRYNFTYYAAPLTAGGDSLVRPNFVFRYTDGIEEHTMTKRQTWRPPRKCSFRTDAEPKSHCFGDPNFPLVWSKYDFREMVYYRSPTEPVPLTDAAYVDTSMGEAAIENFLQAPAQGSKLGNLYFIGDATSFLPTVGADGKPTGVYAVGSRELWPAMYFDLNGDQVFEAGADRYVDAPAENTSACVPDDGYQGVPFSRVLAQWSSSEGVSPKVILTHAQKEQRAIQGYPGNSVLGLLTPTHTGWSRPLDKIMGVQPGDPDFKWASVQIAWAVYFARYYFDHTPPEIPTTPQATHDGELLPLRNEATSSGYHGREPIVTRNFWFVGLQEGVDRESAVFLHTRPAHCLFKYTAEVNKGNSDFLYWWVHFNFDQ